MVKDERIDRFGETRADRQHHTSGRRDTVDRYGSWLLAALSAVRLAC
jgi:hypothetical protein